MATVRRDYQLHESRSSRPGKFSFIPAIGRIRATCVADNCGECPERAIRADFDEVSSWGALRVLLLMKQRQFANDHGCAELEQQFLRKDNRCRRMPAWPLYLEQPCGPVTLVGGTRRDLFYHHIYGFAFEGRCR